MRKSISKLTIEDIINTKGGYFLIYGHDFMRIINVWHYNGHAEIDGGQIKVILDEYGNFLKFKDKIYAKSFETLIKKYKEYNIIDNDNLLLLK